MCGIIGIVTKESKELEPNLNKGISSLSHRGPDSNGKYFFPNCALGHARLSIIDLSTGNQPMLSSNSNLGLVFNGEIYGYKEIKKDLDYKFNTTSDTEVILALYEKAGKEMLKDLPGMFAFGLWDEKNQSLFLARDRFGEKPLFYAIGQNGEFIFASEIKAILNTGLIKPVLDINAVKDYVQRLYVSPKRTIYKNIFTVLPAHYLIFKDNRIEQNQYYKLPETITSISPEVAKNKLKELLEKAVEKQLIADVPVGAFLSGGLDSSTIVSIASKYKKDLRTFSFGFGDSINELPYAKEVSDKFKTSHIELQADNYNLADLFLKMQEIYDEPFADSSNIPTFLLSREAKKYNKVVLTGDGGDELFAGYSGWYKPLIYSYSVNPLNIGILSSLIKTLFGSHKSKLDLYYRFQGLKNRIFRKNLLQHHIDKNSYFSNNEVSNIFLDNDISDSIEKGSSLEDIIRYDITNYMPGDILTKIDRASMAVGLELRSPFLDRDFATFCISLPYSLKIDANTDKKILREIFDDILPKNVISRNKQGFGSPVKEWLKTAPFIELKNKFLNDRNKKIFEILDYQNTQKYILKDTYQTWILLTLSLWLEAHEYTIEK